MKNKSSLGGLMKDGIADVRPNDLQKGLGGKMDWKAKKEGSLKKSGKDSAY